MLPASRFRAAGQETENQLRQLREFAARSGWTIAREYIDHETGKTSDREQFEEMFRDASQRKFDVLLFWALDRLSREGVLPTLQHLQRLTSYGVGYRSFTEQYFDSCGIFCDAVIAIVATVVKQERIRISERVRAGLTTARNKGKRLGRPRVRFPGPDRVPAPRRKILARDRAGTQYQHRHGTESIRGGARALIPRDPLLVRHEPLHSEQIMAALHNTAQEAC